MGYTRKDMKIFKKVENSVKYISIMITSINQHVKNVGKYANKQNKILESIETDLVNIDNKVKNFEVANEISIDDIYFSVVTAAYNSDKYLDDYFRSFLYQRQAKNIEIILVDDGSIDKTSNIIDNWRKNSHLNIKYIYQKNSGQAAARNNGINYASNEWITFIDSDDFISDNYFEEVAKNIKKRRTMAYVAPWIFYYEEGKVYKNTHPLNFRFDRTSVITLNKNPEYINLAVSSVVFNKSLLNINNIKFNEMIKPSFEDGEFYLRFLEKGFIKKITFIHNIEYYYRKREDKSSTIDKSSTQKERYLGLLQTGYLNVLDKDIIDLSTQLTILYDLQWNFNSFDKIKLEFTKEEMILREKLLKEIFDKIDFKSVEYAKKYNLISSGSYVFISNKYYGKIILPAAKFFFQTKEYLIIKILTAENIFKTIKINQKSILEYEYRIKEIIQDNLFGCNEYLVYIRKEKQEVKLYFQNEEIPITKRRTNYHEKQFKKDSTLLFFDRKDKADDNAEALYEYLDEYQKEYKNKYFILEKTSVDGKD